MISITNDIANRLNAISAAKLNGHTPVVMSFRVIDARPLSEHERAAVTARALAVVQRMGTRAL